ncbi:MAG: NUDIX hydrolase [Desulfobacteraceae bacterium]|nr:MAG: NUDIX hydrolase [Desulfobacteraceae bacterium]
MSSEKKDRDDTFLWLAPFAPPKGYTNVPAGGMCLCVFLFVIKGRQVLLGKYKEHPAWEKITGMDEKRVKNNQHGLTLPASHLKFGEDPLDAARRIVKEILLLPEGLSYSEPVVQTFFYESSIVPGEMHFDVLFLYDVILDDSVKTTLPPWYASLEWFETDILMNQKFARQHEDVVSAWLKKRVK